MNADSARSQLLNLIQELGEISLCKDPRESLQWIVEICRETFDAELCTAILVDSDKIYQLASSSRDDTLANKWDEKTITDHLDPAMFRERHFVERYGLQDDGQGVASERAAQRLGFDRMLAAPIAGIDNEPGFLTCFSAQREKFTQADKDLLDIFAQHTLVSLQRARYSSLSEVLRVLAETSSKLSNLSPRQFLNTVATDSCKLLDASTCVIWEVDDNTRDLRVIAATHDVDDAYRAHVLDPSNINLKNKLIEGQVTQIEDVTSPDADYLGKAEAAARHWVSLLSIPIHVNGELRGMLDLYTHSRRVFRDWEKDALRVYARQTAIVLNVEERRVVQLDTILREIAGSHTEDILFARTLKHALALVGANRGWIGKLTVSTGQLDTVTSEDIRTTIPLESGPIAEAFRDGKPQSIYDTRTHSASSGIANDMLSQLMIPLVIQNAEIRTGTSVTYGSKHIGILNVENSEIGAFSNIDQARLSTLAREAALTFERLETDKKFSDINHTETHIIRERLGYEETIRYVAKAMTQTLGFTFVNISLVDEDFGRIRTFHIEGLSEQAAEQFKRLANHPLRGESLDIQADIVKTGLIEVPAADDPRFDRQIHERFNHQNLVRVFVPMIVPPGNHVVGTVEAGYPRTIRPYIFERDVRALNDFVVFVTEALEQRREEVLDRVMHEFRAPVSAIRSNIAFLERHGSTIPTDKYYRKLNDLALDTELALLQVSNVERFLGGPAPETSRERTFVYRDIVIKTIQQVKPRMMSKGFDLSKVVYLPEDPKKQKELLRLSLYLDPTKLQQVVFNLVANAMKYAEEDPGAFRLRIDLLDYPLQYVLSFKDWGIGIKSDYRERVFERGFRTPEARESTATGSGLGLTIAKALMKELGGDLRLMLGQKPTEFQIVLPKTLEQEN